MSEQSESKTRRAALWAEGCAVARAIRGVMSRRGEASSDILGASWWLARRAPMRHAHLLGERAARVGFDWANARDALDKVAEEVEELAEVLEARPDDHDALEDELGDLLFAALMVARKADVDAGAALRRTNAKFHRRFTHIEREFARRGVRWEDADLAMMDAVWDAAKAAERAEDEATRAAGQEGPCAPRGAGLPWDAPLSILGALRDISRRARGGDAPT